MLIMSACSEHEVSCHGGTELHGHRSHMVYWSHTTRLTHKEKTPITSPLA